MTSSARTLRQAMTLGALLVGLLVVAQSGASAAEAPTDPPQLSIAIDNGRTATTTGDTLVYTITVRNLGTADVTGLTVTQTVPTGLELGTAKPAGTPGAGGVGWDLDLKAAAEATFTSTMTVSATPSDLLRLATVACARVSADAPPVVCASHSDQLPAGAAADAARTGAQPEPVLWLVLGGLGVVAAVAVALLVRRRSGRQ